jgi:hypothetical protein
MVMSDNVMTMNFEVEVETGQGRMLREANADGKVRILLPKRLVDEIIRTTDQMAAMDERDVMPVQLQLGARVLVAPGYGPEVEVCPEMRIFVTVYRDGRFAVRRSDELLERALIYLVAGQAGVEAEAEDVKA